MIAHICGCRVPHPSKTFGCGALCDGKKYGGVAHIQRPWGLKEVLHLISLRKEANHGICFRCLAKFLAGVQFDGECLAVVSFDVIKVTE